jgi:hypothetical protein
MIEVFSKGVLRTNYKELIILPTVCNYYLNPASLFLGVLWPRFQSIGAKEEKTTFPMLINSKSIFLLPIIKT